MYALCCSITAWRKCASLGVWTWACRQASWQPDHNYMYMDYFMMCAVMWYLLTCKWVACNVGRCVFFFCDEWYSACNTHVWCYQTWKALFHLCITVMKDLYSLTISFLSMPIVGNCLVTLVGTCVILDKTNSIATDALVSEIKYLYCIHSRYLITPNVTDIFLELSCLFLNWTKSSACPHLHVLRAQMRNNLWSG